MALRRAGQRTNGVRCQNVYGGRVCGEEDHRLYGQSINNELEFDCDFLKKARTIYLFKFLQSIIYIFYNLALHTDHFANSWQRRLPTRSLPYARLQNAPHGRGQRNPADHRCQMCQTVHKGAKFRKLMLVLLLWQQIKIFDQNFYDFHFFRPSVS